VGGALWGVGVWGGGAEAAGGAGDDGGLVLEVEVHGGDMVWGLVWWGKGVYGFYLNEIKGVWFWFIAVCHGSPCYAMPPRATPPQELCPPAFRAPEGTRLREGGGCAPLGTPPRLMAYVGARHASPLRRIVPGAIGSREPGRVGRGYRLNVSERAEGEPAGHRLGES
jgi:hypothetical protein